MSFLSKNVLRKLIKQDICDRLIPVFLERGFAQIPLPNRGARFLFPFGTLKRKQTQDLELIEIQLDKHGAPKFVLNIGVAPAPGFETSHGTWLKQSEMRASDDPRQCRVYKSARSLKWFGVPFISLRDERAVQRAVDLAISTADEIDEWFRTGRNGTHVKDLFPRQ